MNRSESILRCNIVSTSCENANSVGCYLGNGRFGAILSRFGLNLSPEEQKNPRNQPSHFNHMNHWGRFPYYAHGEHGETCSDYIFPLYRLYWENAFDSISDYRQCHNLYDGMLYTDFTTDSQTSLHMVTWFDRIHRNLSGVTIDADGGKEFSAKISLSVPPLVDPCPFVCTKTYAQSASVEQVGSEWKIVAVCADTLNDSSTTLYISTNMEAEVTKTGLTFRVKSGRNSLLVSVDTPFADDDPGLSIERTKNWWHNTWEEISWIEFSDKEMQNVMVRGMSYLLSSYDADCKMIQPANGMGIGGFAYNFVPDIENAAPALLMMGQQDIIKHWVEYFAEEIDGLYRYAKHLWPDAQGIFPPWELNYGPIEGYHAPKVPIIFCYEAHNTGYLCKLAMEAAEFANDKAWAEKYAYPLIRGCAEFFRAFCFKEDDGLWHLKWYPCMGRDEAGGVNKDDYLCTLLTAKYSFQSAIRCGLDEGCDYKQILEKGLAFDSLLSERGTWHTCRGADDFGKQKHPVQLEGIACFPTESAPHPAEAEAYKLRHEITNGAKTPMFWGWTLAQLLIADTNMKENKEWAYDWSLLRPSNNVDEKRIQFYESSGSHSSPFYLVTQAMVMQSLIRNCVNDYWGRLELGTCIPDNISAVFENIHTRLGVSVTGRIENGKFTGTITADRDCAIIVGENELLLKKGESCALELPVK